MCDSVYNCIVILLLSQSKNRSRWGDRVPASNRWTFWSAHDGPLDASVVFYRPFHLEPALASHRRHANVATVAAGRLKQKESARLQ